MGEVELSLQSYIEAIRLLDTSDLTDEEKEEVHKEYKELSQLYSVFFFVVSLYRIIKKNTVSSRAELMS